MKHFFSFYLASMPPAPPIRTTGTHRGRTTTNPPSIPLHFNFTTKTIEHTIRVHNNPLSRVLARSLALFASVVFLSFSLFTSKERRPALARANNTNDSQTQTLKHSHVRASFVIYGLFLDLDVIMDGWDWWKLTSS